MTLKERFVTVLNVNTPVRVPIVEHLFSLKVQNEVLGYNTNINEDASQAEMVVKQGIDMVWVPMYGFCRTEETPRQVNEVYWNKRSKNYKKRMAHYRSDRLADKGSGRLEEL